MENADIALIASIILFGSAYMIGIIIYVTPRQNFTYARVFDFDYRNKTDITVIFTYGEGILKFYGKVDIEVGKTYVFIYKEGGRYKSTYKLIELIPQ